MKQQLVEQDTPFSVSVLSHVNQVDIALGITQDEGQNSVAKDNEDSFFICDLGDVVQKYVRWQENFPRIRPFYAVKCNMDKPLLRLMLSMGTGFDCASKVEINRLLELGADPDQIIYANPCKQSSHIRFACQHGVKTTVFDNEIELYKIKKFHPDANLVLRIETDDSASLVRLSMKFGANIADCPMLLETAKELGLNVIGVSFHVGSRCQDPTAFVNALQLARKVFDYSKSVGYDFHLLDIGGGFPGTDNEIMSFEKIALIVNATLNEVFPPRLFKDLEIIAEPGRYFATSAYTLVTNVIAKRRVDREPQSPLTESTLRRDIMTTTLPSKSDNPTFMYYLNDGAYGSFSCLLFDHAEVRPILMKNNLKSLKFDSSIWGPTCDGLDRIMEKCQLPELQVGDWMVWKDMGAYTMATITEFNGFKTTAVHYCITHKNLDHLQSMVKDDEFHGISFKYQEDGMKDQRPHKILNTPIVEIEPAKCTEQDL